MKDMKWFMWFHNLGEALKLLQNPCFIFMCLSLNDQNCNLSPVTHYVLIRPPCNINLLEDHISWKNRKYNQNLFLASRFSQNCFCIIVYPQFNLSYDADAGSVANGRVTLADWSWMKFQTKIGNPSPGGWTRGW